MAACFAQAGFEPIDVHMNDLVAGRVNFADMQGLAACGGFSYGDVLGAGGGWAKRILYSPTEQYEARFVTVEVYDSPSVLFNDMAGSRIPVAVAHGEGRVHFNNDADRGSAQVALGYVDNHGQMTERYPLNPNGSAYGVTGLTTDDGRVTILMPHPERVARSINNSWYPPTWGERGPWARMFDNARVFVG